MELEKVSYIIQIISDIFVVLAGFVALWQYSYNKRKERDFRDKERVQLAVDIAKFYKENVLAHSRDLKAKLSQVGMLDIAESIKMEQIEHFDVHEIEQVYTGEQLEIIKKVREEYRIENQVNEKSVSYRPLGIKKNDEFEQPEVAVSVEQEIVKIGEEYVRSMFEILNNLEIFAMYFVHETADETVVYQPLHMSYLEIVRMLYYDIAYANRNGARKYYINTIILFNKWKKRAENKKNEEIFNMRSMAETGKILNIDKEE